MKFKISHALIDIFENRRELHSSIPKMKAIMNKLLDKDHFTRDNLRLSLLVHECFSMVGLSNKGSDKLNLSKELLEIFTKDGSKDPFMFTKYEINEESIEFQDSILAKEIFEIKGKILFVWLLHELTFIIEVEDIEEEKFIEYPCEIEDYICDKVLNANGNLSINFFCLILKRFIDGQLKSKIDSIK
jgi:hypothetical protein